MEESKALNRIMEAADLIAMIEEMTNPASLEKLSSTSLSGMRITLKNIRETLLASHDVLAAEVMSRARNEGSLRQGAASERQNAQPIASSPITRRDLRTSIEKVLERPL